jgi:hypothetical protein
MSAKDEVSGLESAALVESVESAEHSKSSHSSESSKEATSIKEEKHGHPEVHSVNIHIEDAKKESHEKLGSEENHENLKRDEKYSESSSSDDERNSIHGSGEIEVRPEPKVEEKKGINTYLDKAKELAIHNKYVIGGLTVAGIITFAAFKKLKKRS